jgi:hypothetical protein
MSTLLWCEIFEEKNYVELETIFLILKLSYFRFIYKVQGFARKQTLYCNL